MKTVAPARPSRVTSVPRASATLASPLKAPVIAAHGRTEHCKEQLIRIATDIARLRRTESVDAASDTQHISQLLDGLYDELEEIFHSKRGFKVSPKEQRMIEATGGSSTYGELMPSGIDAMLDILGVSNAQPGSVFTDLGSGLGRVVLHSALSGQSAGFSQLVGLELSASRWEQGEYVLERLMDAHTDNPTVRQQLQRVVFEHADVTTSPLVQRASHVFMCSTAFGAVACRKIVDLLSESEPFQVLVTSRELPRQSHVIRLGDFQAEMSWNAAGTCHVYVPHDLTRAPPHLLERFLSDGAHMCWLPGMYDRLPVAVEEPVGGYRVTFPMSQLPTLTTPLCAASTPL